ncbi:uncharacterized protein LOC122070768 [Macadamia integrifolia]|uniref:uncharacterized protein LOC122070768 n=1 Tax=Macadamia integrifolia TaxID=60698 RepID=UPI001C4E9A2E|nr:uncharacterized protein LOC122070768 [Macadamia integrifolia]
MERERGGSSPENPASSGSKREGDMSGMDRMKKGWIYFTTSLEEGFQTFKASLIGQVKKMSAKDEKEASEADLQTAKMQVEAADAAEETKKRLDM